MSALHSGTAPTGSAAYSAGTPPGCPTVTSQTDTHWQQQQPHGEPAAPATTNFALVALKSNYVGVSWRHDVNKWEARIRQAGASQQRLGFFLTEEEAAAAFDAAARRLRGTAAHGGWSGPTAACFRCATYKRLALQLTAANLHCRRSPRRLTTLVRTEGP